VIIRNKRSDDRIIYHDAKFLLEGAPDVTFLFLVGGFGDGFCNFMKPVKYSIASYL